MGSSLNAGLAEIDITPPPGLAIAGSLRPRRSHGVRDRLLASCLVLENRDHRLALVGCDLLLLPRQFVASLRQAVQDEIGIPGRNIAVFCTHTHTGPLTCTMHGQKPDATYLRTLFDGMTESVRRAAQCLEPAEIASTSAFEHGLSFNRRIFMKDGLVRTHPIRGSEEISHAEGPIDPEIAILCVRRPDGPVVGYVVNFACHVNVIRGDDVSADYAGALRRRLKDAHGQHCVTLFSSGFSGDVCQIDVSGAEKQDSGVAWAETMGKALAHHVLAARPSMVFDADPELGVSVRTIPIKLRDPRITPYHGTMFGGPTLEFVDRLYDEQQRRLVERLSQNPEESVEIQALRIGDAGLVMVPGEPFAAHGIELKIRSPLRPTLTVGLANGYEGYIPTEEAFNHGGYEVRTGDNSKFIPGAGAMIIHEALEGLSSCTSQIARGTKNLN